MPGLTIGDTVPDLRFETTHGTISLHDYIENSKWVILFSHPGDFTPVCTTELGMMAAYAKKFAERGAKLLGLSCDDVESHKKWIKDIEAYNKGHKVEFPIISDPNRELIKQLNMNQIKCTDTCSATVRVVPPYDGILAPPLVDPDEKDPVSGHQVPSRALYILGPDKKIKLGFLYPASTGRNMDEVVRVLDSLEKSRKHKVATPANWKQGEPVVIAHGVSSDEAKHKFPHGFNSTQLPSNKEYLRFTHVGD